MQINRSCSSIRTFEAARQQLLRTLSHHMVNLAERINLMRTHEVKQRLLDSASNQWRKTAQFEWKVTITYDPPMLVCQGERYYLSSISRVPSFHSAAISQHPAVPLQAGGLGHQVLRIRRTKSPQSDIVI